MKGSLLDTVSQFFGPAETPPGLAISGGGDSVALLCLMVEAGLSPQAVTVDHGLRPEAAAEADWVAALCSRLGVTHDTLRWSDWDGTGNLQDQARRARLRLIAGWARERGIATVAMAHTRDDQAETVLMRLARRAGVDGLSAMAARRTHLGITWARPLLDVGRDELRDWLRARGQDWLDDPSNEVLRFDRVKARRALARLAPLGITAPVLADVARQMQAARQALDRQTEAAARQIARVEAGDVILSSAGLAIQPDEIARRLILTALQFVAPQDYAPRSAPVAALLASLAAGKGGTLAGCRITQRHGAIRVTRELKAIGNRSAGEGQIWDARWRVFGPWQSGQEIRALGQIGLAQCRGWRITGLPRPTLLSSPAIWSGDLLVAAPLARSVPEWRAEALRDAEALFLSALSH